MDALTRHDFCSTLNCESDDFPLPFVTHAFSFLFCCENRIKSRSMLLHLKKFELKISLFLACEMPLTRSDQVSGIFTHKTQFFCLAEHSVVRSFWTCSWSLVDFSRGAMCYVRCENKSVYFLWFPLLVCSVPRSVHLLNFIYDPFGLSVHFKMHEGIMARKIYCSLKQRLKIEN